MKNSIERRYASGGVKAPEKQLFSAKAARRAKLPLIGVSVPLLLGPIYLKTKDFEGSMVKKTNIKVL